jgi:hypothetical protein
MTFRLKPFCPFANDLISKEIYVCDAVMRYGKVYRDLIHNADLEVNLLYHFPTAFEVVNSIANFNVPCYFIRSFIMWEYLSNMLLESG